MLVVISDLHFEEEQSRNIEGPGPHPPIRISRNIRLNAFTKIFCRLSEQARRDGAHKMNLVLAGDIFELHRTALWFHDNPRRLRPYVSTANVEADLEAKVLHILHAINEQESPVHEILAALQRLVREGYYVDEHGQDQGFPVPVELHYIPGNHDRLANATATIRRTVREFLGLSPSIAPFRHMLTFDQERALVRHGHEYDHLNFSQDYRKVEPLPLHIPGQAYDDPPIGDFVTVDLIPRISQVFRECHGNRQILGDPLLRRVYERILEFDDLRPAQAIFNFLLYMPDSGYAPEQIWRDAIKPVAISLLNTLHDHPFLHSWLKEADRKGRLDTVDAIQAILVLQAWNWKGLTLQRIQSLSDLALRFYVDRTGPERLAACEETILNGEHLFVVAGHTHRPAVKLIGNRQGGEQYYVDTGTWRRQIPATPGFRSFGRVKSLTYAVIYGPGEDPGSPLVPGKIASLDYWTGVTERWVESN